MHNLSLGLLSCLEEEAGRGKGASARLPALLSLGERREIAPGLCQNHASAGAEPGEMPAFPCEPAPQTSPHADAVRAYNTPGDAARLPEDRKASPKPGGRWQPRDGISPPAAAGKNLGLLQSIG